MTSACRYRFAPTGLRPRRRCHKRAIEKDRSLARRSATRWSRPDVFLGIELGWSVDASSMKLAGNVGISETAFIRESAGRVL